MRTTDDQGSARLDVTCATCREALSAQLDGEQPPVEAALHVARCAECAAWARDVPSVLRPLRMRPADEVPDLTERILAAIIGSVPRPSLALTLGRAALMAVAVAQAVIGVLDLVGAQAGIHAGPHAAAESAAWNLAIAIAFATAALRPRVAYAVLPMVASLVAVLAYASVRDLAAGQVTAGRVLAHVIVLAGLVLVALLAWRMRTPRAERPAVAAAAAAPGLMPR